MSTRREAAPARRATPSPRTMGPGGLPGPRDKAGPEISQGYGSNWGEGLLDYAAAARYLCTTPRQVRELWAKRHLAAVKVGRHVRFTRADLDAFIRSRRVDALR